MLRRRIYTYEALCLGPKGATRIKMTTINTRELNPVHEAILAKGGIDAEFAKQAGAHSINEIEDLPESQQYLFPCEGMVFEHLNPFKTDEDGNPVVVSQVRFTTDEDIPAGMKKYMQEPNSGSCPSVHPSRLSLIGNAKTLVIAEGSKGGIAVAKYAPSEFAIIGILGITGTGDSKLGVADWFSQALIGVERLVIIPDADVKTNYNVWTAVDKMVEFAKAVGVKKVVVGVVPGGGSYSIDDVLGKVSVEQRYTIVSNIINMARTLGSIKRTAPRKPKEPKASDATNNTVPKVFWDDAEIRMPDYVIETSGGGATEFQGEKFGSFAARISAVRVVRNDLDGKDADQSLELDLVFNLDSGEYTIKRVSPKAMHDWRDLLDNIPGGAGVNVDFADDKRGANQRIERAVRTYESMNPKHAMRTINVVPRSGLIRTLSGDTGFLMHESAIGEFGNIDGLEGDLSASGIATHLLPVDLTITSQESVVSAVKALLGSLSQVHDETPLWALLGASYFAPTGLIPHTGLGLVGLPGSGKSTLMQFVASQYGAMLMDAPMFAFDGTANAVGSGTGIGWHTLAIICDDLRYDSDSRVRAAKLAAFDLLMRRGYGGGMSGKRRQTWSAEKGVGNASPDAANPVVIVGAEPGGFPAAADKYSTVERMLVIGVETETSLIAGGEKALRELVDQNVPAIAFNAYLRWLCEKIDAKGGLTAWSKYASNLRDKTASRLKEKGVVGTPRSVLVASTFVVGTTLLIQFANDIGAIDDDEVVRLIKRSELSLNAAAREHFESRLAGARTGFDSALEKLRTAIAGEEAWLTDGESEYASFGRGKSILIGRKASVNDPATGKPFNAVVLNPDAVAKILKVSKEHALGMLREKAVKNRQGRYGWDRNAGAGTIKTALVLHASDFFVEES